MEAGRVKIESFLTDTYFIHSWWCVANFCDVCTLLYVEIEWFSRWSSKRARWPCGRIRQTYHLNRRWLAERNHVITRGRWSSLVSCLKSGTHKKLRDSLERRTGTCVKQRKSLGKSWKTTYPSSLPPLSTVLYTVYPSTQISFWLFITNITHNFYILYRWDRLTWITRISAPANLLQLRRNFTDTSRRLLNEWNEIPYFIWMRFFELCGLEIYVCVHFIFQHTTVLAQGSTRTFSACIFSISGATIKPGDTGQYHDVIHIPPVAPSHLDRCRLIDVTYMIHVGIAMRR